jgi:hypothetical protein
MVGGIARDLRLFEARYDIASAARFIHMSQLTIRNWAHGTRAFQAVLELPQRGFLSFINLTEAYVLHAIRRRYEIPLPRVRAALTLPSVNWASIIRWRAKSSRLT